MIRNKGSCPEANQGALQAASVLVLDSIQLCCPTRVKDIKTFCLIIQSQTVSSVVLDVSASMAGG